MSSPYLDAKLKELMADKVRFMKLKRRLFQILCNIEHLLDHRGEGVCKQCTDARRELREAIIVLKGT